MPLILLTGIAPGVFVPAFPVYVVGDDPVSRCVEIAVDEGLRFLVGHAPTPDSREYAERLTRLRLHQPVFRARVLAAYDRTCAICRLRHVDLLDAAHIQSDAAGGQPVQDVHDWRFELPRRAADRPDRHLLQQRYAGFSR